MYIRIGQVNDVWCIDIVALNGWVPVACLDTKEEALSFVERLKNAEIKEEVV